MDKEKLNKILSAGDFKFSKRLNILEKLHFKQLKQRNGDIEITAIFKLKLSKCTLYICCFKTDIEGNIIKIYVRFGLNNYKRVVYRNAKLGTSVDGYYSIEYGDYDFPEKGIERIISFLNDYVINPEITEQFEKVSRECNSDYIELY